MSDNEIIKNLKYCCLVDPKTIFIRNDRTGEITTLNMNDVFNLINRLQAEIEVCNEALDNSMKLNNRLKSQNKDLSEIVHKLTIEKDILFDKAEELKAKVEMLKEFIVETRRCDKEIKSEAYKEFAELLQNRCIEQQGCLYSSDIGAVYNELVGEQNAR